MRVNNIKFLDAFKVANITINQGDIIYKGGGRNDGVRQFNGDDKALIILKLPNKP